MDNEVVDEIYDLYKSTGEKKVIIPKADSYVMANGIRYTYSIEEKATVQRIMGQTAVEIIDEAMDTQAYEDLTDAQKVEFITKAYSYAKAKAKSSVVYSYDFLRAIYGEILTKEKYDKFTDAQKKKLAQEHFISAYAKVKDGEEVDYFLNKIASSSKTKAKTLQKNKPTTKQLYQM